MMETATKITQCDIILQHMKTLGSISALEAVHYYNILRLASRIKDLKRKGYRIDTEMRKGKNGSRYAEYSLAKEGN